MSDFDILKAEYDKRCLRIVELEAELKIQDKANDILTRRMAELESRRGDNALREKFASLESERDRYMRALVHIRLNSQSMLDAQAACARIAGEFMETSEYINARWNYTEANAALTGGA